MDDVKDEPRALKKKKKKKVRRAAAAAEPMGERPRAARARPRPAPPPEVDTMEWTRNHVVIAALAGVVAGGMGGYWFGKSADGATAGKDSPASQSAAPGTRGRQGQMPGQQAQQPAGRVHIPLAKWSPRRGPEHAKVTILDFSDFQ